jgi:hypothetical protein
MRPIISARGQISNFEGAEDSGALLKNRDLTPPKATGGLFRNSRSDPDWKIEI